MTSATIVTREGATAQAGILIAQIPVKSLRSGFHSQGACSSAGRALPWHGRGRRFDPDQVHQLKLQNSKFVTLCQLSFCQLSFCQLTLCQQATDGNSEAHVFDGAEVFGSELIAKGRRRSDGLADWPTALQKSLDDLNTEEKQTLLRVLSKIIANLQDQGSVSVPRMCTNCSDPMLTLAAKNLITVITSIRHSPTASFAWIAPSTWLQRCARSSRCYVIEGRHRKCVQECRQCPGKRLF